jgi:hypothetical protein
MSEKTPINGSVEFLDHIKSYPHWGTRFKPFQVQFVNLVQLRESLKHRPCACGGVNPDAVLMERRASLDTLFNQWVSTLSEEQKQLLKENLNPSMIFKNGETVFLET